MDPPVVRSPEGFPGILDGIRIVDLTTGLAGPVATQLLAEAGAEVVKVEPPGGDPWRGRPGFATWNRSKQSVVVDLCDGTDRARLDALIGRADVVVHRFPPERARRLALDAGTLSGRHPRLVVVSVTGYPHDHPDAERSDLDILVQARAGFMDEQRGHRDGPVHVRFPLQSWCAAYATAAAVVARLIVRERTGAGGSAHTSLYQAAFSTLPVLWRRSEVISRKGIVDPMPKDLPSPAYGLFRCADDAWIQVMGGWEEVPALLEALASHGVSLADLDDVAPALRHASWAPVLASRPSTEWVALLRAGGAPVEPVGRYGDLLRDPGAWANGFVVEVDDPVWGRTHQAASPFLTEPPSRVRSGAPELDHHDPTVFDGDGGRDDGEGHGGGAVAAPAAGPAEPPLAGLRVVDFGMYIAGPSATMLLADLGADVVKVEMPTGDRFRSSPLLWLGVQRNKRSLAIDLATPEGREVLGSLVRGADVVHHNLLPAAAARLGLDVASLQALNPSAVVCHLTAYGHAGPRAEDPGYDPTTQALSGWSAMAGGDGNPPSYIRFGHMDQQAGLASLVGTLLALLHRQRTGTAGAVRASLLASAVMTSSETLVVAETGELAPVAALDAAQTGVGPGYRIYPVSDGWVAVGAVTAPLLDELRAEAGVAAVADVESALAGRPAEAVLSGLARRGVPAELVRTAQLDAFFDSEDNRRVGLVTTTPQRDLGALDQPGAVWQFDDRPLATRLPPPAVGEHSRQVLAELGVAEDVIDAWVAKGIVVQAAEAAPTGGGTSW